jgi:hypothetical protein
MPAWLVVLVLLGISVPIGAQLQQSGGGGSNASVGPTGSTAPTSATLAGGSYNSTLPTLTNGQMGSLQLDSSGRLIAVGAGTAGAAAGGVFSVQGVASGTALPVTGTIAAVTAITNALPAGTNVIGYVRTVPLTGCGTTAKDSGLIALPNSSTAVTNFTVTTCIQAVFLNNTSSSAQVCSISDGQGTPVFYISSFSIPGNSNMLIPFGGIAANTGLKWSCTTAAVVNGQVLGWL